MKVLIINNLQSGLRDGSIFEFMRKLAQDGDELIIRCTDGSTPIESLLDGVASCDLVVAAGGDGTIAPVCYALRFTGIPILPFPAGTGNLLATNLDQPEEPYALVEMARKGHTLDFDLGEISFETDGGQVTKGFIVIAGAGYDATIMGDADRLKEALGPAAYIAAAITHPNPTVARFTLHLDDQTVTTDGIAVLVLNFAKIYPDISITHANDARDGLLEVAVVKPHTAVELLPAFFAAFLDRTGGFPHRADALETFRSKSVRIESSPALPLQYDGEAPGGTAPFAAHILPGAVRLVVTEQEYQRLTESREG
ncbi:MAG: NAD(+)/NADH kinase [Coriobacteriales bacterium]|jgi:diacylglycerol kinase family enzyme|nr:NAD(+)/NADH kinase [Coriobacteriales bacterium]